jgi:adenine-specific DNA-methyltransferase
MPTLQFKGKNIIWNHHLSIPYHTLDEVTKLDFQPEKGEGNLIIEGDNLLALKALLPMYAGRVKCIYIDPPYNTGSENWVYNDKTNSPLIKEWLGKVVSKDDLTKHDKWLCMLAPRLKLLRELLSDDGVIFISIDDNEQHHLRQLTDEIFGEDNFITNIIWQKKYSPQNDAKYFSDMHDFILCYAKKKNNNGENGGWVRKLLPRTEEMNDRYNNPDKDHRGDWKPSDFSVKTYSPEYDYTIKTPSGKTAHPPTGRCWMTSKERFKELCDDNRIWFGETGSNVPSLKKFLTEVLEGIVPVTVWLYQDAGHNQLAKQELKEIFGNEFPFDSPKPVSLLKKVFQIAAGKNSLILDSFAGSGTTMHAVMDLNNEDGGNRKCILIQMPEATEADPKKNICKDISRERVKRAIEKYGYDSGFKYLRVGIPIDAESMLSGNLPTYKQFAKYVYYLCTGRNLEDEKAIDEKSFFAGEFKKEAVYLVYKQDYETLTRLALNLEIAERITKEQKGKKSIVYAPACFLEEDYLKDKNIEYVGIPYNLFKKNGR